MSALGFLSVRGRRRVPSPAAKIIAFIGDNNSLIKIWTLLG
jgi:hypothetical protein